MPTIGTARVQTQTGLITFPPQTTPVASSLSSFSLQTPTTGINLFENYSNQNGNVILQLRSLSAGTGVQLNTNQGVIYLSLDPTFVNSYAPLDEAGLVPWTHLPPNIQSVPIAFCIPAKLPLNQLYNLVLPIPCTIPADLTGTVVYVGSVATSNALFQLRKISGGVTTDIGSIIIIAGSHTNCTLSMPASTSLAVGDVLQLISPSSQDATMADVGITILAER